FCGKIRQGGEVTEGDAIASLQRIELGRHSPKPFSPQAMRPARYDGKRLARIVHCIIACFDGRANLSIGSLRLMTNAIFGPEAHHFSSRRVARARFENGECGAP